MVEGDSGNIGGIIQYDSLGVILPNKMRIHYPMLRNTPNGFEYISNIRDYRKYNANIEDVNWTNIYGGKMTEIVVQALARIVVSEQMVEVGKHYKVLFQVHDELIITLGCENKTVARQHVETIMSTSPAWAQDLPVACESGVGNNYGDTK